MSCIFLNAHRKLLTSPLSPIAASPSDLASYLRYLHLSTSQITRVRGYKFTSGGIAAAVAPTPRKRHPYESFCSPSWPWRRLFPPSSKQPRRAAENKPARCCSTSPLPTPRLLRPKSCWVGTTGGVDMDFLFWWREGRVSAIWACLEMCCRQCRNYIKRFWWFCTLWNLQEATSYSQIVASGVSSRLKS